MLRDHHVPFRREDYIAEVALLTRKLGGSENYAYFNIVDFVERILMAQDWKDKGRLGIKFFDDRDEADDPAYVTFDPPTLHVDRETWELARAGEPDARFVIAHEVGHIVLHRHDAQHFSKNTSVQIKFANQEYSAEWQANTFASYFLVPTRIMSAFDTVQDMTKACLVNEPAVLARYCSSSSAKRHRVIQDATVCLTCGNISRTSDGVCQSADCPDGLPVHVSVSL